MATGYTAAIGEGIGFEDFVMSCARAMGACITMREEPSDAPIPEKFEPGDYYAKRVATAEKQMAELDGLTPSQAQVRAASEHNRECAQHTKWLAERAELADKYAAMLERVNAWGPPTEDHVGLKEFMASQIAESIKFDCGPLSSADPPTEMTGEQWHKQRRASVAAELERAKKSRAEELDRVEGRNRWIAALRESLRERVAG